MNRELLVALGHQISATLHLAISVNDESDEEFGREVIGALVNALEHVRNLTHIGNN